MSRYLSQKTVRILLAVGVFVAVLPVLLGSVWGWYCAHPRRLEREPGDTPAQWGIPYEDIQLSTADGLSLAAWWTPSNNQAVILVGHGFAASRLTEIHALFARHGYGVLSWDFRAHGASEGQLCSMGRYEVQDVEAAVDYALAQPDVEWIAAWGGSMGGITALNAAPQRPEIKAVVADSVAYSASALIDVYVQPVILRPFFRYFGEREIGFSVDLIRPVDRIGELSPRPVYIIQGMADRKIPLESGQLLYDAASEPRILWLEPGVDHLEMHLTHPEEYERRVIAFLDAARQEDGHFSASLRDSLGRPIAEVAESP